MYMTDLEIHNCIEQKNQMVIDTVKELFGSHTSSIATLITSETQGIKEHIKKLEDQVTKQNGSVRDLKEWRARHDGIEDERSKQVAIGINKRGLSLQHIAVTVSVLALLVMATFQVMNYKKSRATSEEVATVGKKVDDLGAPTVINNRGDVVNLPEGYGIKMWPNDYTDSLRMN